MNELRERIITYRWLKFVFYFIFVSGISLFLFTLIFVKDNFVRNGFISVVFMLFAYISNEVCNLKIKECFRVYNELKNKNKNRYVKVIDFEKIA